jgi:hypothetical protein
MCQGWYCNPSGVNHISMLRWLGEVRPTPRIMQDSQWVRPSHSSMLRKYKTDPLEFKNVKIIDMETYNKLCP